MNGHITIKSERAEKLESGNRENSRYMVCFMSAFFYIATGVPCRVSGSGGLGESAALMEICVNRGTQF